MKPTATNILKVIATHATPARALSSQRYFKTGDGEYAAGDIFVGVMVPQSQRIAREFGMMQLAECKKLLRSPIHEARLIALFILCDQFKRGDEKMRAAIYKLYLANTDHVNNWDLVDTSAPQIVGEFLLPRSWRPLKKLARSPLLWERRIAIVATFAFIRADRFEPTIKIAEILLYDSHDLIHKACGWMLREVGKRDVAVLKKFLRQYGPQMPRTTLRYATKKFDKPTRKKYLAQRRVAS